MAATPYKPVSIGSESLTQAKLQQMNNNSQWLFENTPRIRYSAAGVVRDSTLKIISGKARFSASPNAEHAFVYFDVYFGSFFTAGCKPVVTCTVETTGNWLRKYVTIRGLGGWQEVDHNGFKAHVASHEGSYTIPKMEADGWVHWTAVGY